MDEPFPPSAPARTVLLYSTDAALEAHLCTVFAGSEVSLVVCEDETELFPLIHLHVPDMVLMAGGVLASAGTLLVRLRANDALSALPVIALSPDTSVGQVVRCLRLGATDVRPPVTFSVSQVMAFPAGVPLQGASLGARFIAWSEREGLSGELRVLSGTPLEGVAVFLDGLLQRAGFCGLADEAALH